MIVVDASFALKLFLVEPDSVRARDQWRMWEQSGEVIIAPGLFPIEMASGLRRSVYRGLLPEMNGDVAFDGIGKLGVEVREPPRLYVEAWDFAKRFNRPTIYDCCYLALASIVGCEFWTADMRLVNAVGGQFSWVRHVE